MFATAAKGQNITKKIALKSLHLFIFVLLDTQWAKGPLFYSIDCNNSLLLASIYVYFFQGWNSATLFSSNKSKIQLLNLSMFFFFFFFFYFLFYFFAIRAKSFHKTWWEILKIPSPLNLFDNKSGQLGGDRLQDWLYKCNQHTLQTFRVRHLDTKDLNVKSFSFILVWINWLCLKILIANFSQTIVLGGLLDVSPWRL